MISYDIYKLFHLLGLMLIFFSVGAIALHASVGGRREENPQRKALAAAHGIGLLLMLVAGFGLLARVGGAVLSGWVLVKLVIWLVLGASTVLPYRYPKLARWLIVLVPALGAVAAYLARSKPF